MLNALQASGYALIFLAVSLPLQALALYVLDLITPGHHLGRRLLGDDEAPGGSFIALAPSQSAALVTSAWMIMQAFITFTAVWTNAHGDSFGAALGWSVFFSLVGLVFQTIAFYALDLVTPGKLSDEVCAPGKLKPIACVAAANVVAVGVIVIAVIS